MIRDFFIEMWFRDRQSPAAFLIQIGCIFMALFGGIINSGFPYTCQYAYIAFTIKLEIFNPTAVPQMNYLIPCKESQIKKERMVNCICCGGHHFGFSELDIPL